MQANPEVPRVENSPPINSHQRLLAIVLFAGLIVAWFGLIELRGLFQPDEGRYAEIPLAMFNSGDWVTPRLNGFKYFEKPPLQYWITAATYALFGADEWTARLWPALTGFLGIAIVALTGKRLAPAASVFVPVAVLCSSWGYFVGGQVLTLDMGLSFFLTAALCAFVLSQQPDAVPGTQRRWMLGCWAAIGLGVLSKGLVAIVLPSLALAAYVLLQRDWRLVRRLELMRGIALLAVITVPWFLLVQARNPEFFHFFFIREHLERFALPNHHRTGPWWYFLPIVALAMLPWTALLPRVCVRAWRHPTTPRANVGPALNVDRLLLIWAVVIVGFFSASSSKLPAYILPALPALALLIARNVHWNDTRTRLTAPLTMTLVGAATATALVTGARAGWFGEMNAPDLQVIEWLRPFGWTLTVAGVIAAILALRGAAGRAMLTIAAGSLLALQFLQFGLHRTDERYSSERLVDSILGEKRTLPVSIHVYSVETFDDTVPFYLGRPITLVSYRGELGPGIAAEPEKFIASTAEFVERWKGESQAYAIMTPAMYDAMLRAHLPMHEVSRDLRRVLVARAPHGRSFRASTMPVRSRGGSLGDRRPDADQERVTTSATDTSEPGGNIGCKEICDSARAARAQPGGCLALQSGAVPPRTSGHQCS